MKIIVVGSSTCGPCKRMKNDINFRIEELKEAGATFEYIDLNELDDKDTFIAKNNLNATPTIMFVDGNEEVERMTGYVPFDFLLEVLEGLNKCI